MTPQNKTVHQVLWHFYYVDPAVEGSEMSKFTHGEAGGIRRLPHRWLRTTDALGDYFEDL